MKITYEDADAVYRKLKKKYGAPDWILGYGVDHDAKHGFAVTVRVAHGHASHIGEAAVVDGVRVKVVEREMAKALAAPVQHHVYEGRKLPTIFG